MFRGHSGNSHYQNHQPPRNNGSISAGNSHTTYPFHHHHQPTSHQQHPAIHHHPRHHRYHPTMTAGVMPQVGGGVKPSSSMDVISNGDGGQQQQQQPQGPCSGCKPKQRFEILKKLGSGTYGKVSLAYDHKLGQQIAVKIIKKNAIENAQDLIRIRREIRIMSALKHPNIIEIKEVFENDDKIIIVMEYADGGELYDFVSMHGPLSEENVSRLFRQIVSAVFYCHKHGVVHRDLKLENILLDKNLSAKIADFGLSNYFTQHGLLHTFCGSPLYASPEIINGVPYRGPEVDCWSLGVLLYTLAYSSMPFDGRDFNRMIRQIKKGVYYEPDPPSSASMLIRAMLRVNPERRADIEMIASHWWLNFDENLPSIHELPENQVLDPTPLCQRKETIVVQNYVEDSEMFSEFNYLSAETRKKIEEFRRRRREADQYVYDSIHNPKRANREQQQDGGAAGAGAGAENVENRDELIFLDDDDPLQRLRDLEARLYGQNQPPQSQQQQQQQQNVEHQQQKPAAADGQKRRGSSKDQQRHGSNAAMDYSSEHLNQSGTTPQSPTNATAGAPLPPQPKKSADSSNKMLKKLLQQQMSGGGEDQSQDDKDLSTAIARSVEEQSYATAHQEEGNRLVNQLLEEAERGVVPVALIEKIRMSEAYRTQNFVKEIVDSMLDYQQQHHQQQQQHQLYQKIKKPSVTKMSTMARQNSKDVAPGNTAAAAAGTGSSSRTMTNSMCKQSSRDRNNSMSMSLDLSELPDLVRNNNRQDSSYSLERPPDLVADDQQSSKLQDGSASVVVVDGASMVDYAATSSSKKEDLEGIEEEESVDSTDFEDLDIDDDEEEEELASLGRTASQEEDGSPADSFVTATEGGGGASRSTGTGTGPTSVGGGGPGSQATNDDEDFPPGLSKRLSRGKYEKSKFIFENSAANRKTNWLKTIDPDMGSSQEIETPPRSPSNADLRQQQQNNDRRRGSHNSDTSHNRLSSYKVLWPPPKNSSALLAININTDDSNNASHNHIIISDNDNHTVDNKANSAEIHINIDDNVNIDTDTTTTAVFVKLSTTTGPNYQHNKQIRRYNAAPAIVPIPYNRRASLIDEMMMNHPEDDKEELEEEVDEYVLPPNYSPRDSSHHLQKRNRKFSHDGPLMTGNSRLPLPMMPSGGGDHHILLPDSQHGYDDVMNNHQQQSLSFAQALLSPRYDQSTMTQSNSADKKTGRNFTYKSPPGTTSNLHKDEPLYVSDGSHLHTNRWQPPPPYGYQDLPLHIENIHHSSYNPVNRNSSNEFIDRPPPIGSAAAASGYNTAATGALTTPLYQKRTNLANVKSKSIHDLSPERTVLAAKQYLDENPDLAAERRKHKSWYEGSDRPVISAQPYYNRALSPDPLMISNALASTTTPGTYHPEVYQPKGLAASSPYYKSRFDSDNITYRKPYYPESETESPSNYTSTSATNGGVGGSASGKFKVFQPKGLLKRRSRSVEKGLYEEDPTMAEANTPSHPTVGFYQFYQPPTSAPYGNRPGSGIPVSSIGLSSTDRSIKPANPLKGILKKTSHYGGSLDDDSSAYKPSTFTGISSDPYRSDKYGSSYGSSNLGSSSVSSKPLNFVEKIKRHLSTDKPSSATTTTRRDEIDYPSHRYHSTTPSSYGSTGLSSAFEHKDTSNLSSVVTDALDKKDGIKPTRKKRSLLQLGRRKTTELRYGGTSGTSDFSPTSSTSIDHDTTSRNRRASSPLEKIKGLFTVSSSPATKIGTRLKDHTGTSSLGTTREPPSPSYQTGGGSSSYTPTYRKPLGSTGYSSNYTRPHSTYAPKSKYAWQEDSSFY